jgi:hypothetical protein
MVGDKPRRSKAVTSKPVAASKTRKRSVTEAAAEEPPVEVYVRAYISEDGKERGLWIGPRVGDSSWREWVPRRIQRLVFNDAEKLLPQLRNLLQTAEISAAVRRIRPLPKRYVEPRACLVCDCVFIALRRDQKCCSKKCATRLRVSRWRVSHWRARQAQYELNRKLNQNARDRRAKLKARSESRSASR